MIKYRFLETTSPSRKTSTSPSMARKLGIPHSKRKTYQKGERCKCMERWCTKTVEKSSQTPVIWCCHLDCCVKCKGDLVLEPRTTRPGAASSWLLPRKLKSRPMRTKEGKPGARLTQTVKFNATKCRHFVDIWVFP